MSRKRYTPEEIISIPHTVAIGKEQQAELRPLGGLGDLRLVGDIDVCADPDPRMPPRRHMMACRILPAYTSTWLKAAWTASTAVSTCEFSNISGGEKIILLA